MSAYPDSSSNKGTNHKEGWAGMSSYFYTGENNPVLEKNWNLWGETSLRENFSNLAFDGAEAILTRSSSAW